MLVHGLSIFLCTLVSKVTYEFSLIFYNVHVSNTTMDNKYLKFIKVTTSQLFKININNTFFNLFICMLNMYIYEV